MSNKMSFINKFSIFNECDQQFINKIKLFFAVHKLFALLVTVSDDVFICNPIDGIKRIEELCNKSIIKFESNGASNSYFMALSADGRVYSWGYNTFGQLGHNTNKQCNRPTLITSMKNYFVTDISCGYSHSLLLTRDGLVFSFGYNIYGQCGNNSLAPVFKPNHVEFTTGLKIISIASGYNHSTALTDNGIAYVWGSNKWCQLGIDCQNQKQLTPFRLDLPDIKQLFCGPKYILLLTKDGDIYICGRILRFIQFKVLTKLNIETKFDEIAATIRCNSFAAMSESKKCFIYGKCGDEKLNALKETGFNSINDAFANFENITFKSVSINNNTLVDESYVNCKSGLTDASIVNNKQITENLILNTLFTGELELNENQNKYKNSFTEICSLGVGGFSNVFKAKYNVDNCMYAIKKVSFDEEKRKTVNKELMFLSKLKSEFVVEYFNSWIEKNYYINSYDKEKSQFISSGSLLYDKPLLLHIQMELCSLTLRDVINKLKDCLTPDNKLSRIGYYVANELMAEILECVDYLHSQKPAIIHRDLKPENILITGFSNNNRFVKLADFGLSTFHEIADQSHTKSVGTTKYRAPEVHTTTKYTTKSDLFSLGIIWQELMHLDFDRYREFQTSISVLSPFYKTIYTMIVNLQFPVPFMRYDCVNLLDKRSEWCINKAELSGEEDVLEIINSTTTHEIQEEFVEFFIYHKFNC